MKLPDSSHYCHHHLLNLALAVSLSMAMVPPAFSQYSGYFPNQVMPGQGYPGYQPSYSTPPTYQNRGGGYNPYAGPPVSNPYQQQAPSAVPYQPPPGAYSPSTQAPAASQQYGEYDGRRYDTAEYDAPSIADYTQYSDQGSRYYQQGQLTKAIESFEKALPLAPEASIPIIYNNLAAAYIKRGNYYNNTAKQHENALSDFREAVYWLEYGWPEGMERKDLHVRNLKAARENMDLAYRAIQINPLEKDTHLEMAKKLRLQGKFRQAAVEYARAVELDKGNTEAMQALGDLFNVLNQPHKSNKFYQQVTQVDDTAVSDDLLVQLGNSQYKAGKVDDAVVSFNKALAKDPGNTAALGQLEKIWLNEIKFNPASVLGHANLAGIYQKQKKYDLAFQQYQAAEHFSEQDPKTTFEVKKLIRLNIGTLFQEQKDYAMALKSYDTVLHADPNHKQANFYKATALEESGNFQGALDTYNHLLAVDPEYPDAKKRMFGLIKKQTDPAKLDLGLREYADRFSQDATIQAQIGEDFHQKKDYQNAEQYYQRAIQLNPQTASAYANLGAVYQAQGREEESLRAYEKARQLDPKNETVAQLSQNVQGSLAYKYFQQGVEAQEEGNLPAALDNYKKAMAITPDNPDLLAAYGAALQNSGEIDKALPLYQKAIALTPDNADFHYYLATVYHQKNDLSKALASYKKALSLDASQEEARQAAAGIEQAMVSQELNKAIEAFTAKRYPDALTLVNKALTSDATNATSHYYKGLILNELKKPDQALLSYKAAIQHDPGFGDAYYALAILQEGKGDKIGARQSFGKFVELSVGSDDDFVRYAKDRLQALSQ